MAGNVPIHASVAETLATIGRETAESDINEPYPNIRERLHTAADVLEDAAASGEGGEFVSVDQNKIGCIVAHSSVENRGVEAVATARSMLRHVGTWNN